MDEQIDHRILHWLDERRDDIVADLVINFRIDPASPANAQATAQAILDDASRSSRAVPTQAWIMPRPGTICVGGSNAFLKHCLADQRLCAASLGVD